MDVKESVRFHPIATVSMSIGLILLASCGGKGSSPQNAEPSVNVIAMSLDGLRLNDSTTHGNESILNITYNSVLEYLLEFSALPNQENSNLEYQLRFGCLHPVRSWMRLSDEPRPIDRSERELGQMTGRFHFSLAPLRSFESEATCSFRIVSYDARTGNDQLLQESGYYRLRPKPDPVNPIRKPLVTNKE